MHHPKAKPGPPIHAIVLTLNEEVHLARCLASIRGVCATITVVDSGSIDRTVQIAERGGADVITNAFVNHAAQLNFAIDRVAGRGGWLLRVDADEVLTPDSVGGLAEFLARAPAETAGILVRRRMVFMGRVMRWGGMDPIWQLRVWREGRGRCEMRWMDEHLVVDGVAAKSPIVVEDRNERSIDWWTAKHNDYASREAIDVLSLRYKLLPSEKAAPSTPQAARKRALKEGLYARLPGPVRTSLYFLYRYVLRLGFLDGKAGFYFHVLQGFWYRTLVDAKIADIEAFARANGCSIAEAITARTGLPVWSIGRQASPRVAAKRTEPGAPDPLRGR